MWPRSHSGPNPAAGKLPMIMKVRGGGACNAKSEGATAPLLYMILKHFPEGMENPSGSWEGRRWGRHFAMITIEVAGPVAELGGPAGTGPRQADERGPRVSAWMYLPRAFLLRCYERDKSRLRAGTASPS